MGVFTNGGEEVVPRCQGCGKEPHELPEYLELACSTEAEYDELMDPTITSDDERRRRAMNAVLMEEGTLNPENGHFLCNMCYINAGMPSSPSGWKCP